MGILSSGEMNTRKDDRKDENLKSFLEEQKDEKAKTVQMMYHVESLAAGTKFFYWKVCLIDTNEVETGAFLQTLQTWSEMSSQVGGNGRVGHGALKIEFGRNKGD